MDSRDSQSSQIAATVHRMAEREPPSWVELLTLMVHPPAPEPTVRGAIRSNPGTDESRKYIAYSRTGHDSDPVIAGAGATASADEPPLIWVWRDGAKVRLENSGGSPSLIVGEEHCWQFGPSREIPVVSPSHAVRYLLSGTNLVTRRDPNEFAGTDFTRPTGPIGEAIFLNRRAWTVELAPPKRKPYPIQLVVDAETGLILQERNDDFGSVDEWVEFVVGEEFDDALFTWTGPAISEEVERAERDAEHEADLARRRSWFEANVAPMPLRVELSLPVLVNHYDEATGEFVATLGNGHIGTIARRPHAEGPTDEHTVTAAWSDGRWDWTVSLFQDRLTEAGLEALKRQLGSG